MADTPALDLEQTVRSADPDRWLASRFIDEARARADVIALYAFNHELARAPEIASEPLLAEIRLTWWGEALDEMFEGRPVRRHPVAQALAAVAERHGLDRAVLAGMIDARMGDAHKTVFADEGELFGYLDATAGALMRSALLILGGDPGGQAVQAAGRAWGLAGLARMRMLGAPSRLPETLALDRIEALTRQAGQAGRAALQTLPVRAFPAIAYACLARPYAAGRELSLIEKQARLIWASATGRI